LRSGRIRPGGLVLSARSQCAGIAARENGGEGHDEILLFVLIFVSLRVVLIASLRGYLCVVLWRSFNMTTWMISS
jgi:hypothetical protein